MFKLDLSTTNAAFDEEEGNAGPELARILRAVADRIEDGVADSTTGDGASIRDINGNKVGEWHYWHSDTYSARGTSLEELRENGHSSVVVDGWWMSNDGY